VVGGDEEGLHGGRVQTRRQLAVDQAGLGLRGEQASLVLDVPDLEQLGITRDSEGTHSVFTLLTPPTILRTISCAIVLFITITFLF